MTKEIANNGTHKGLVTKQLIQLSNNKKTQPNQKMGRKPEHFPKDDIQMANSHIKRCSSPVIIREMQIKTTMLLTKQTE